MPAKLKRTAEIEAKVIERLSKGEPLTWICKDLGFTTMAWYDWCAADEALQIAHGRARDAGHDAIAADCLNIADQNGDDTRLIPTSDGGSREVADSDWIQRSKLRVETRLKLLAKWDPRRYGEKLDVQHSGQIDLAARIAAARERKGE